MFLFGNKFYAIFLSIWIVGFYMVISKYRVKANNEKKAASEIEYLQGELNAMQQKLLQLQSINNELLQSAK